MVTQKQLQLEAQATAHEAKEEWQEAIALYLQTIALNPKDADLRNSLGIAYEKVNAFDHAETCYKQAIDVEPTFYPAHYNLSQLYRRNENRDAALRAFAHTYAITQTHEERLEVLKTLEKYVGEPVEVCQQCECISPFISAFQREREKILCPYCRSLGQARRDNQRVFTWVGVLAVLALFTIGAFRIGADSIARMSLYYILYVPVTVVFVTLHELVHAIVARLSGGKVFSFSVGQGGILWQREIKECTVTLHKIPLSGLVQAGIPSPNHLYLKAILFVTAPLLFHLALVLGIFAAYGWAYRDNPLIESIFWVNLLMFLSNALPFKTRVGPNRMLIPSDGAQFLSLLRQKSYSDTFLGAYYHLEALRAIQAKQFDTARSLVETGLTYHGDNAGLLTTAGIVALRNNAFDEAIHYFHQVLDQDSVAQHLLAITWNNLGYASLLARHPAQGYEYAQKAMWVLPWYAYPMGTMGIALVETGEAQKGVELLEEAIRRHTDPSAIADLTSFVALGYFRLGAHDRAHTTLEKAVSARASDYVVAHIKQSMNLSQIPAALVAA